MGLDHSKLAALVSGDSIDHETIVSSLERWKIPISEVKGLEKILKNREKAEEGSAKSRDGRVGKGHFGEVVKCAFEDRAVVVKISRKLEDPRRQAESLADLENEAYILGTILPHANLVDLRGIVFEEDPAPFLGLVLSFCEEGALKQFMRDDRYRAMELGPRVLMMHGIAAGIAHLHREGVEHRDLWTANILLDGDLQPKIADFGLAITQHTSNPANKCQFRWCSPERCRGHLLKRNQWELKNDVWSFGMIAFCMLTSERPFADIEKGGMVKNKVLKGKKPSFPAVARATLPDDLVAIVDSCWRFTARQRPTMAATADRLLLWLRKHHPRLAPADGPLQLFSGAPVELDIPARVEDAALVDSLDTYTVAYIEAVIADGETDAISFLKTNGAEGDLIDRFLTEHGANGSASLLLGVAGDAVSPADSGATGDPQADVSSDERSLDRDAASNDDDDDDSSSSADHVAGRAPLVTHHPHPHQHHHHDRQPAASGKSSLSPSRGSGAPPRSVSSSSSSSHSTPGSQVGAGGLARAQSTPSRSQRASGATDKGSESHRPHTQRASGTKTPERRTDESSHVAGLAGARAASSSGSGHAPASTPARASSGKHVAATPGTGKPMCQKCRERKVAARVQLDGETLLLCRNCTMSMQAAQGGGTFVLPPSASTSTAAPQSRTADADDNDAVSDDKSASSHHSSAAASADKPDDAGSASADESSNSADNGSDSDEGASRRRRKAREDGVTGQRRKQQRPEGAALHQHGSRRRDVERRPSRRRPRNESGEGPDGAARGSSSRRGASSPSGTPAKRSSRTGDAHDSAKSPLRVSGAVEEEGGSGRTYAVAHKAYHPSVKGELELSVGDVLLVLERAGSWWKAVKGTGRKGFFPADCVKVGASHSQQSTLHRALHERKKAKNAAAAAAVGSTASPAEDHGGHHNSDDATGNAEPKSIAILLTPPSWAPAAAPKAGVTVEVVAESSLSELLAQAHEAFRLADSFVQPSDLDVAVYTKPSPDEAAVDHSGEEEQLDALLQRELIGMLSESHGSLFDAVKSIIADQIPVEYQVRRRKADAASESSAGSGDDEQPDDSAHSSSSSNHVEVLGGDESDAEWASDDAEADQLVVEADEMIGAARTRGLQKRDKLALRRRLSELETRQRESLRQVFMSPRQAAAAASQFGGAGGDSGAPELSDLPDLPPDGLRPPATPTGKGPGDGGDRSGGKLGSSGRGRSSQKSRNSNDEGTGSVSPRSRPRRTPSHRRADDRKNRSLRSKQAALMASAPPSFASHEEGSEDSGDGMTGSAGSAGGQRQRRRRPRSSSAKSTNSAESSGASQGGVESMWAGGNDDDDDDDDDDDGSSAGDTKGRGRDDAVASDDQQSSQSRSRSSSPPNKRDGDDGSGRRKPSGGSSRSQTAKRGRSKASPAGGGESVASTGRRRRGSSLSSNTLPSGGKDASQAAASPSSRSKKKSSGKSSGKKKRSVQ